jgi:hypothetical protein
MRQIRQNVFETNSSSSHSLVVTKTDRHYTDEEIREYLDYRIDDDGLIKLYSDEAYFGRSPFNILSTFREKMMYAYACAVPMGEEDVVTEAVQEFIPEFKGIKYDRNYQSIGTDDCLLFDWLGSAGVTLVEFLSNDKYKVICDGDEYCIWSHAKKSGLINMDFIEEEY